MVLSSLTHLSLSSFLWDIGKQQYSPRCLFIYSEILVNIFTDIESNVYMITLENIYVTRIRRRHAYNCLLRPRCDSIDRGAPSGAILFAKRIFIKNLFENLKSRLMPLKIKVGHPINDDGRIHSTKWVNGRGDGW